MNKLTCLLILLVSSVMLNISYGKEIKISSQEQKVIALVKKAKEYIAKNGKEKAIAEFNKKSGKFSNNSSYVFAVDYNGTYLATINYPALIGTNQFNLKDSSGIFLVQEEIEKAKAGGGWIKDRLKKNPQTGKHECKASYILPMAGYYFIGSGYYYPADEKGNCRTDSH